ncbi:MAG: radical SAM protein [Candidatus Bathyarchaeia archaeon]
MIRIPEDVELPLIGCIAFGLIDRGTNLIQVRPVSGCNLNCIYCSVDEGPKSKTRVSSFIIDPNYLIEWFKALVNFKQIKNIEAHIDGAGEPTLHPKFREVVAKIAEIKNVNVISLQTNGTLLKEKWINELSEIGLSRINLSINALDDELAKKISGIEGYNVKNIIKLAEAIAQSSISLLLAPVWIPSLNDEEIPKLIEFALKLKPKSKWPLMGIQKYEVHTYGRKVPGVKPLTWRRFYEKLYEWEKKFNLKLKLKPNDFGIIKTKMLPLKFHKGEIINLKLASNGWMKNQAIGVKDGRAITVVGISNLYKSYREKIKVKIIHNKHNIYVGKIIP